MDFGWCGHHTANMNNDNTPSIEKFDAYIYVIFIYVELLSVFNNEFNPIISHLVVYTTYIFSKSKKTRFS